MSDMGGSSITQEVGAAIAAAITADTGANNAFADDDATDVSRGTVIGREMHRDDEGVLK
jgi:hypothetical protein